MIRTLLFALLLLLAGTTFAQNRTWEFQMTIPQTKISSSLYNRIQLMDVRTDTTNLGIVFTGGFGVKKPIVPNPGLQEQLSLILKKMAGHSPAIQGNLLLRLHTFNFTEANAGLLRLGACELGAELLVQTNAGYQLVDTLNAFILANRVAAVTDKIMRSAEKCLVTFLERNLSKGGSGPIYNYQEVRHLDSVWKSQIPAFSTNTYKEGLYRTYQEFANQTPSKQVSAVVSKNGKLRKIRLLRANEEDDGMTAWFRVYAIVFEGQIFISTLNGYYPVYKKEDNFFYQGAGIFGTNTQKITAGLAFGAEAILFGNGNTEKYFTNRTVKINYRNGNLIILKKAD